MKWRTFSSLAALTLLLPVSADAAQLNSGANHPQQSASVVTPILAQSPQRPAERRFGKGERIERWLQQLDLTPEQSQQIQTIQEQARTENADLRQELQQARSQMQSLFASDADAEQLQQQHDALQALHQELGARRFETMLEVREVLTPEQRTQLAELRQQRGQRNRRLQ